MEVIQTATQDGIILNGFLFEPQTKSDIIIINIHGMAGSAYKEYYYSFMRKTYPQNNITFLATENRGAESIVQFVNIQDEMVNIGDAYEIFEHCFYDIDAWLKTAQTLGYSDIWLQAHSFGPTKVLYYLQQKDHQKVNGLIFLSPVDMYNSALVEGDLHKRLLTEANKLIAEGMPDQLLSEEIWSCKLSANTYSNFFETNKFEHILNYVNPEKCAKSLGELNIPVIAFTGTDDVGIVPVKDAFKSMTILEQLLSASPRKKTVVFEGGNHDFNGFGQEIVDNVVEFVVF